ncbi:hypothetical protein THRCLA_10789 [Thraustotheca clavata]|uniref:Uncharacterized protein n=1 Tax=Thraustotheca clavata TaxID=74557 RepID=A0A1V9YH99_9STRA|nr:hypothetical protein THRCLA_10789 [Thraustotheca clavata]
MPTVTAYLLPKPAPKPSLVGRRGLVLAMATVALLGCGYVTTEAILPPWLHGDTGPIPYVVPAACVFDDGDRIALQADTGKFIARCNNCLNNGTDVAFVLAPSVQGHPSTIWKVFNTGRLGTLALQADSGKFLARCNDCATPAAYIDVDHWSQGSFAQWTCVLANDGRIALRADTGKYLARDNEVDSSLPHNAALIHEDDWSKAWAQWAVDRLPVSAACTFNDGEIIGLQADTGNYMARCSDCLPNAKFPDVVFAQSSTLEPWAVYNTGNGKLALQSASGKYLTREYKVVPGASAVDQAFTSISDFSSHPWAEFTCVDLSNGKIALEADTGKFVARCANCLPESTDSVAMDCENPKDDAGAQWTVVRSA